MSSFYFTREEVIESTIGVAAMGCDFWGEVSELENGSLVIADRIDDDGRYTISREQFFEGMKSWAEKNKDSKRFYVQDKAQAILEQDWDNCDIDPNVGDSILQEAIFGKQKYA